MTIYYVNSLITDSTCIYVLRWFSDDDDADFADLRISVNAVANILLLWRTGEWMGRRGRDRMVVGFTTTYAISVYHDWCSSATI